MNDAVEMKSRGSPGHEQIHSEASWSAHQIGKSSNRVIVWDCLSRVAYDELPLPAYWNVIQQAIRCKGKTLKFQEGSPR